MTIIQRKERRMYGLNGRMTDSGSFYSPEVYLSQTGEAIS